MKKSEKKLMIITSIICLLPIIIGILFYKELPDNIAIHFDINSEPTNYFSKPLFIFGVPIFMMLLQIISCLKSFKSRNKEPNKKANMIFSFIIPTVTVCMYCLTLLYALGNQIDIKVGVMIVIGILFIITGNYLPKTKSTETINFGFINHLNEELYKKLSHISGYLLIFDGLLFILSILFDVKFSICILVLVIIESIFITIYSLLKNKS